MYPWRAGYGSMMGGGGVGAVAAANIARSKRKRKRERKRAGGKIEKGWKGGGGEW